MDNNKDNQKAIDEILKSIKYLLNQMAVSYGTKIYDGLVIQSMTGNKWKIRFNGEEKDITLHGNTSPKINSMVKVYIPQGNYNLAYFEI